MSFGGISLGMKSEKNFKNVEFKFKKLKFNNCFFGVLLLKLDETFYNCFIALDHIKNKFYLEKLMNLNSFNLIVFNNDSKENKIYNILNDLKNQLLFSLPNQIYKNFEYNIISNDLDTAFSAEMLWNY